MNEDGTGRESEYLRRLLPEKQIAFYAQPFTRQWSTFLNDDRFDAVATVPDGMFLGKPEINVFWSAPYIYYQNGIGFSVDAFPEGLVPADLARRHDLRVAAFAGAADIVPELRENAMNLALYVEVKDQLLQSSLLKSGKVDAVVEDQQVFRCYNDKLDRKWAEKIKFVPLARKTGYRAVFRRQADRDAFDRSVKTVDVTDTEKKYAGELACRNVH